jgi:cysteinyl-tRNA synthetase
VLDPLCNDLNVPAALTEIHSLLKKTRSGGAGDDTYDAACELAGSLQLLGFERLISDRRQMAWLDAPLDEAFRSTVEKRVAARANARKTKNFAEADRIRDELAAMGIRAARHQGWHLLGGEAVMGMCEGNSGMRESQES